jgi:flavin reductase (DIM6/NTAB) family NADH-FMN oxidoreductase RutF
MAFEPVNIRDLGNPVRMIADEWALLSAGTPENWNTMTVSWGGLGELWGFEAAFVFVRPQRYTHEFLLAQEFFTLSFGAPKAALHVCGSRSGRDGGKLALAGLTAAGNGAGAVWPAEAKQVLICQKAAIQKMDPAGFLDPGIAGCYPQEDYHTVFVGKVIDVRERR